MKTETVADPTLEYCYQIHHGYFGWIGGDIDENWGSLDTARWKSAESVYPTRIISRPKRMIEPRR